MELQALNQLGLISQMLKIGKIQEMNIEKEKFLMMFQSAQDCTKSIFDFICQNINNINFDEFVFLIQLQGQVDFNNHELRLEFLILIFQLSLNDKFMDYIIESIYKIKLVKNNCLCCLLQNKLQNLNFNIIQLFEQTKICNCCFSNLLSFVNAESILPDQSKKFFYCFFNILKNAIYNKNIEEYTLVNFVCKLGQSFCDFVIKQKVIDIIYIYFKFFASFQKILKTFQINVQQNYLQLMHKIKSYSGIIIQFVNKNTSILEVLDLEQQILLLKNIYKLKCCYQDINNAFNLQEFSMQIIAKNFEQYQNKYDFVKFSTNFVSFSSNIESRIYHKIIDSQYIYYYKGLKYFILNLDYYSIQKERTLYKQVDNLGKNIDTKNYMISICNNIQLFQNLNQKQIGHILQEQYEYIFQNKNKEEHIHVCESIYIFMRKILKHQYTQRIFISNHRIFYKYIKFVSIIQNEDFQKFIFLYLQKYKEEIQKKSDIYFEDVFNQLSKNIRNIYLKNQLINLIYWSIKSIQINDFNSVYLQLRNCYTQNIDVQIVNLIYRQFLENQDINSDLFLLTQQIVKDLNCDISQLQFIYKYYIKFISLTKNSNDYVCVQILKQFIIVQSNRLINTQIHLLLYIELFQSCMPLIQDKNFIYCLFDNFFQHINNNEQNITFVLILFLQYFDFIILETNTSDKIEFFANIYYKIYTQNFQYNFFLSFYATSLIKFIKLLIKSNFQESIILKLIQLLLQIMILFENFKKPLNAQINIDDEEYYLNMLKIDELTSFKHLMSKNNQLKQQIHDIRQMEYVQVEKLNIVRVRFFQLNINQ